MHLSSSVLRIKCVGEWGQLVAGWDSRKVRKGRQRKRRKDRQACAETMRGSGRDSGTKKDVDE
jgi:hypothetical protein